MPPVHVHPSVAGRPLSRMMAGGKLLSRCSARYDRVVRSTLQVFWPRNEVVIMEWGTSSIRFGAPELAGPVASGDGSRVSAVGADGQEEQGARRPAASQERSSLADIRCHRLAWMLGCDS